MLLILNNFRLSLDKKYGNVIDICSGSPCYYETAGLFERIIGIVILKHVVYGNSFLFEDACRILISISSGSVRRSVSSVRAYGKYCRIL